MNLDEGCVTITIPLEEEVTLVNDVNGYYIA